MTAVATHVDFAEDDVMDGLPRVEPPETCLVEVAVDDIDTTLVVAVATLENAAVELAKGVEEAEEADVNSDDEKME